MSNNYIPQVEYVEGQQIVPTFTQMNEDEILDKDWSQVAFMVPDEDLVSISDIKNKYFSTASAKFTDTRLGCNFGINPKPQWTRYADIRKRGRLADRKSVSISKVTGNHGMGSAYSEMIDDPSQKIYMRFGVFQFNSLVSFLSRAFDSSAIVLARTGRAPSAWFTLGKVVGTAIGVTQFPALYVTVTVGKGISWLIGRPTSKFCTLKPTMFAYWNTVNMLVNNHAVNEGFYKRVFAQDNPERLAQPYKIDYEQSQQLSGLLPDIFNSAGYIDAFAVANKAQRLASQSFAEDYARLNSDNATATDFYGYLKRDNTGDGSHTTYISDKNGNATLGAWLNELISFGNYYTADNTSDEGSAPKQELDPRVKADEGSENSNKDSSYIDGILKAFDSELRDGGQFACFRVDYTGAMSESFSSTYGESELSRKLNDISQDLKSARFSLADGNIFGGILGDITAAVTQTAMGALEGVSMGLAGLIPGLGGSGFIDIPKHWQSSVANLPRGSYKIKLISPYNNPISRLINIWIPFYMLLAACLPRSIGKQGYTSPWYCQIFDRGRWQSRLAGIEGMTVTRGTSNLGFDLTGKALALDIDLSIVDLSSIMHIPISSGNIGDLDVGLDEDNIASDYLNVLAGMDIYSQIYAIPKAQLRATKALQALKYKATSPHFHAALFRNVMEDGFLTGPAWALMQAPVVGSTALEDNIR